MSISTYKTKSGEIRYRVEVEVGYKLNGKPDRRTKTCKTMREAKRAHSEYESLKSVSNGRSDRITFQEFVNIYYMPAKQEALRKTTLRIYKSIIKNHLMPAFGNREVAAINRLEIQRHLSRCATNKTAKNFRDTLRAILGEAVLMELIKTNPAAGRFKLPPKKDTDRNHEGAVISDLKEHQRIIDLATPTLRPVLVLGFCFGLRPGEILGLDWKDIDFKSREITIRQGYVRIENGYELGDTKTEQSKDVIPMSEYAAKQLKEIKGDSLRIGAVCVHTQGRMKTHQLNRHMVAFVKKHKLPEITAQSLRHCFATAAIKAGVPIEHVSKILRHTTITTTYNKYVKPLKQDVKEAAAILDRGYGNA